MADRHPTAPGTRSESTLTTTTAATLPVETYTTPAAWIAAVRAAGYALRPSWTAEGRPSFEVGMQPHHGLGISNPTWLALEQAMYQLDGEAIAAVLHGEAGR